jgi:CubicO group peptidase (beta-lactamase class C family)
MVGSTLNRVSLKRRSASDLGVAAAGVAGFVDALGQFEMHGLLVVKRGTVVAEAEWAPYRLREPVLMYSLSKGFTSVAVGLAVAEGLLSLDDRVLDHLPEYADRAVPELRDLRIRHVLTMSSGHDRDLLGGIGDPEDLSTDLVELLVSTPPVHAPGSWFQYNQPATFTAAAVVQRRANVRLLDYLRTRLFEPFDAAEPLSWIADSRARDLGFSGLRTDIETVACLVSCCSMTVYGTVDGCCPRGGLPTRRGRMSIPCVSPIRTGDLAMASRSGGVSTGIGTTAGMGSSAWSSRRRKRSWRSRRRRSRCRPCSTRCTSICCRR